MDKGWTEERRKKQAEAIRKWKPWEKSTGSRTEAGKERTRLNACRHRPVAEVEMLMRYRDSPEPPQPGCEPNSPDDVLHASFRIGDSVIMASDGNCAGQAKFDGFSLAISVANKAEAERLFAGLGNGGQVQMPLTKTFFSPSFDMLKDRFGVAWMILVEEKH